VLIREDGNPMDSDALLVTFEGTPLGYVPYVLSADIRRLLTGAETVRCAEVGGSHVPVHMRLVVEFEAPDPGGFAFDRKGAWEPAA
jgi:hypothetical protein